MTALEPTPRTTVRRGKDRAEYDRATIDAILDEAFVCHAACAVDGTVWMIPTAFGRDGDRLLLHGAAANHVLRAAAAGAELTVTVTLVDGLVLARSVFNHSINYRSVTLFGHVTDITDPAGHEALMKLVETADVFLTSYLPQVRRKLRIDGTAVQTVIHVRSPVQPERLFPGPVSTPTGREPAGRPPARRRSGAPGRAECPPRPKPRPPRAA